jgi:hypothetical protein
MKYLILTIPSIEYAKAISRFIWAITIDSDQSTMFYNSWIQHPQTNEVALAFIHNEKILIHPNANAKALVDQVRNAITQVEANLMENTINEGGLLNPLDFIPASLSTIILTHSEMENAGWFAVTINN